MNNILTTKRTFGIIGITWAIMIVLLVLSSCGSGPQKNDAKEIAEEHNDAKFENKEAENDAQYLVDAYSIGLYEIELSQHAKQKAVRDDVKELASKMIESHAKQNELIKSTASANQVSLQDQLTDEQLKEITDLGDKKGLDLDKTYLDKIIADHEKAIKLSEKAADKANVPEIRNLFSNALSPLRAHLEIAMGIKDKIK